MIQATIPFGVGLKDFKDVIQWLNENMEQRYVWIWPDRYITFENDDDATMYMLKFGGSRHYSKIEQMIKAEDEAG